MIIFSQSMGFLSFINISIKNGEVKKNEITY